MRNKSDLIKIQKIINYYFEENVISREDIFKLLEGFLKDTKIGDENSLLFLRYMFEKFDIYTKVISQISNQILQRINYTNTTIIILSKDYTNIWFLEKQKDHQWCEINFSNNRIEKNNFDYSLLNNIIQKIYILIPLDPESTIVELKDLISSLQEIDKNFNIKDTLNEISLILKCIIDNDDDTSLNTIINRINNINSISDIYDIRNEILSVDLSLFKIVENPPIIL